MIGSSNGKTYEDSVDHFLGNPIEDDFESMKSGRKPAQEPAKKPSGDVSSEFPTTPFEKWWIQDYIGRDSARPKAIHGLDYRQNLEIDRLLKDMIPGPVDQQITPGEQIHDPQGQGRDVRVSDVAGQQYAMEDKRIRTPPEGPGRPTSGGGSVERVDRPAIKIGDELFEGRPGESHYHVMVNNGRLQKMPGKDMDRMESGWVTNTGRYVSREEAMAIAKKSEQIKAEPKRWKDDDFSNKELISEDFTGGRGPDPRARVREDSSSEADMASFLRHLDNFIPRKPDVRR